MQAVRAPESPEELTERETEVLRLLVQTTLYAIRIGLVSATSPDTAE